jgi:integrase
MTEEKPKHVRKRRTRRRFGAVRKLPSGLWQARYPDPATGRLIAAPTRFRTKKDAELWLSEEEAKILRGAWIDPNAGKITVRDWGDRWFTSARSTLKAKTVGSYESLLRTTIYPTFGDMDVAAIKPIQVAEWVAELRRRKSARTGKPLSASRVRQAYRVLSLLMAAAVENELIARSPCRGVRMPKLPETDPQILTNEEMDRIIAYAKAPHDVLISLLAYGGLRIGEAFALRRLRFEQETWTLTIAEAVEEVSGRQYWDTPKGHRRRSIRLPLFVTDQLARHLRTRPKEPDTLIFVGRTGNALRYNSWRRSVFDPAAEAAGFEGVTPHDLRASHGTWIAERFGVMAAAKRLGHANASVTTRHYARASAGSDEGVADGLDDARNPTAGESGPAADDGTDVTRDGTDMAREWHDGDGDDPKEVA